MTANNGDIERFYPFLESLNQQTLCPEYLHILLYPSDITQQSADLFYRRVVSFLSKKCKKSIYVYRHGNSDYIPGNGIGYDRNRRLQKAKSDLVYLIDDDNSFAPDFIQKSLTEYVYISDQEAKKSSRGVLYSPTVVYAKTKDIQSMGIKSLRRWLPKYNMYTSSDFEDKKRHDEVAYHTVSMMGGNSLLGQKSVLQDQGFDEAYMYSYEDIDFTQGLRVSGTHICCSRSNQIFHHESKLGILESKFLGSDKSAYRRARSRIRFSYKYTNFFGWMLYVCIGLPGQTFYFVMIVLVFAQKGFVSRILSILSGTRDGFFCEVPDLKIQKYTQKNNS